MQAFVFLVSRRVDALEECVSKTERSMDPGKLRKMFTSLPGVFSVSVLIQKCYLLNENPKIVCIIHFTTYSLEGKVIGLLIDLSAEYFGY